MNIVIGIAAGVAGAFVVAGCATPVASLQSPTLATTAPQYRVGDRWVYRVRDGFANPTIRKGRPIHHHAAPDRLHA